MGRALRPWRGPAAVAVLVALLAAGCSADPGGESQQGSGTIVVGARADRMSYDPHASEIGHQLHYLQPVYDTLLREAPDRELVPMLATDWSYSADATVLELALREGVTFIDGEPFNAEAVEANLEHARDSAGPRAAALAQLQRVEVVDEATVRLHLSRPDPMLLHELASVPGMQVSPAALSNPDLDRNPVGSGPFLADAEESVDGDHYVYERNPDYWDPSLVGADRLEIRLIPDANARLAALQAGQIDMALGTPEQVTEAEGAGLTVLTKPVNWRGLNLADRGGTLVPALADPQVRRAMNHAIDRQAIVDTIEFGRGMPATQIYPADSPANIDPQGDLFPFDPALARDLLEQAGYPDGFTIDVPLTTTQTFAPAAEAIAGYLSDVGIELPLDVIDVPNQLIGSWMDPAHPLAHISFGARHPAEIVRLFVLEDGSFNPFATPPPQNVAALLDRAASAPEQQATQQYAQIAELVTEQAWFLVTHTTEGIYFVGPRVEGVEMTDRQNVPSIYGWQVQD